ncbi:MAG: sucrase ferredoxin [Nocardioidaceae bacterium]|nr:sucrase ferredoxin [Nocardioidaceae bacterium]
MSELHDEPLAGTASTVTRFLLLEEPGPWGQEILTDSRLSSDVRRGLEEMSAAARVRVLFIRRHGRSSGDHPRCFAVDTHVSSRWVQTTTLQRPEEVLDLDLSGFGSADGVGLDPHHDPLFLVCTHGRRDTCCAERGRPLARALSHAYPEQTWECSHVGGDRFAGNLVILPDGLCYGRADAVTGPQIAGNHVNGKVELAHLRGRTGLSFAGQAAEWQLRSHLGVLTLDGVRPLRQVRRDDRTEVTFSAADGRRWEVVVKTTTAPEHYLTCARVRKHAAPRFTLLSIKPVR